MRIDRRSTPWCVALAGVGALGLAVVRQQREREARRQMKGKVVLITGGSRGLGLAIALQFASLGARLALTARDEPELQRAKAQLLQSRGMTAENVFLHPADVSVPEDVKGMVAAVTAHFGQIDMLVNDAGIIMVGPLESQTLGSFEQAMATNFYGPLYTTLAVLPQMMARGHGAIVNIASIGGKVAFPHLLPYVASKFALTGWSQGLRAELAAKGIQVTTVCPGIMRTGSHIQARFTGNTQEEYRWFASATSFPGTAVNATTAASKIVKAAMLGSAEVSIGLQAIAAARLANLAPEVTARLLSLANGFLPAAPAPASLSPEFWAPDRSVPGKDHRGSLLKILERTGTAAIDRYNQGKEDERS